MPQGIMTNLYKWDLRILLKLIMGAMVYSKTGIGFHYLKAYLGEELFDNCMNEYFKQWKFKHPDPEDIKLIFEKVF